MGDDVLNYFAYGSNMSVERLYRRIGSFEVVGRACLQEYRIHFNIMGQDGSAKANILFTGNAEDWVWGVVYRIPSESASILCQYEIKYRRVNLQVLADEGTIVHAYSYIAEPDIHNFEVLPKQYYKNYILKGAMEHSLPEDYIRRIQTIDTWD